MGLGGRREAGWEGLWKRVWSFVFFSFSLSLLNTRQRALSRSGGSRDPQLPARPAWLKPAYLLCGGSVHGACSRNGPALVGVKSASGRFLHGPPLGSRPGSGPPPLSSWPRRRVRLRHWPRRRPQLREEGAAAAAASGRDHLGRKPRRAQMS